MKRWKVLHQGEGTSLKGKEDVIEVLLKNRNIKKEEYEDFITPHIENVTIEAVGIDNEAVKKTLKLIKKAVSNEKDIVIYGDYDVDGICGTAILWETIYAFYKQVHPYIPHRVDEGYGLSIKGIENMESTIQNIGLIITVDNGIVANKPVEFAKSKKIDIVITDHHTKGAVLPSADAVVHTTELCGTGVAYLLSQEIARFFNTFIPSNHLELVALATVADLVPLNKHNRTLLKAGLESLHKTKRPGLLALFREAKIEKEKIDTYHIGHMIAPRLNASGRITHAFDSLRLICTTDAGRANKLAGILNEVNKERQQLTFDSAEHAKLQVSQLDSEESLLFVHDETYDQGVVGLIASKLVEEFYKPSIAVSVGEKISKGSARSISGVNIIELIRSVPEFLAEAGGHPMAAGFSVETEKLQGFKKALEKKAKELIDTTLFNRELKIDLELPFDFINPDVYLEIQKLAPFGMGNPSPVFMTKGVTLLSMNKVGKDGTHLQMAVEKDGNVFKAIQFKSGDTTHLKQGQLINIAYTLELNEWNGNKKLELRVKDCQHLTRV